MTEFLNRNLLNLQPSGIRHFTNLAKETEDCIMLSLGEPDFGISDSVKGAVTKALAQGKTHYPPNTGNPSMRIAVVDFEKRLHGLNYTPDEVIMTNGATEAIYVALLGILNPGDEVIIPIPAFSLYESITVLAGATPVFLDTSADGFQISAEKLQAAITPKTKAIILNSPNNPTGVIYNQQTLQTVHDAVQGKSIFVLCDDVYNQIIYDGPCPLFAAFEDLKAQILVAQSFSKSYAMTGFRMGYLLGDQAVIEKLALLHAAAVVSVVSFNQDACIQAIHSDIMGMVWAYDSRRKYLCERLDAIGLDYVKPEGAFYVFPSIKKFGIDAEAFCTRLIQEAKVATVPGTCFGMDGYIRLSYSCTMGDLKAGISRLEDFLKTL